MKDWAKNLYFCRILCWLGRIGSLSLLPILVCCRSPQPQKNMELTATLFETEWYSIRLPSGWHYSGNGANCVFTSPDKVASLTLAPVVLMGTEKTDSVISKVEKHLLQDTKNKRVVSFRRGRYKIAGQQVPALYVVQDHFQQSGKKRFEVINTYVQKKGWLLGITVVIRQEAYSQARQQVDRMLSSLQIRAGLPSAAERISVRHLSSGGHDEK